MARSVDDVRQDLREFVGHPFQTAPRMPLTAPGIDTSSMRRSSVLILFGALDRVPAAASASAAPEPAQSVPPELDVLLTRRGDTLRHHAGEVAFPGGGEDPDDVDPAATALREAWEETGLDPAGVEVLGALPPVPIPVSRNLVTPVVGWWRLPSEVAADRRESVEVFRAPVAELLDPASRVTSVRIIHAPRPRLPAERTPGRAPRMGLHRDPALHDLRRARLEPSLGCGPRAPGRRPVGQSALTRPDNIGAL